MSYPDSILDILGYILSRYRVFGKGGFDEFYNSKVIFFYPANLDGIIVGLWAHKSTDEGIQLFNDESIDWIVNTIAMDFASLHQNLQESLNESNGNTGTNKNYQDNCWDSKNYPKEAQLNFFFLILALLRIICF